MNRTTSAARSVRTWTLWIITTAALAVAQPAAADDTSTPGDVNRAEAYAAEAFTAYTNKDYDEAIVLYLKSLEAAPSANVLYNLARIYDTKVGDRELAISYYRRYVADPGADPERVRTANERLRALRELDVMATEAAPRPRPATPAPSTTTRERKMPGLQIAGLVTGLTGLAGLGVGTGFGLAAKSDADVAKNVCHGNDCTTQRGVDAAHDASHRATIATASFIAGGALVLTGGVLFLWGRSQARRRDTARLQFAPSWGKSAVGGQFTGRW